MKKRYEKLPENAFRETTTVLLCYGEFHDFIEQTYHKEVSKAELG